MARTRQQLNLRLLHIIFPSLSPNGDHAAIGIGGDFLTFFSPPIQQRAHPAGSKEISVLVRLPSRFVPQGEGEVLILQKRLCKKAGGGAKKKKDYSHRPCVPREACLGD